MPKDVPSTPKEPHRSFTVRIPQTLYNTIGDLAIAEEVHVNVKVNQLLNLGLGKHVSLDRALARLIKREVTTND
jgi:antitoxin component of MazEF toxin-antitoxin module